MYLFFILDRLGIKKSNYKDHIVENVFYNSKEINNNSIFFAIKGNKKDGNDYVEEAIKNGAKTIITESIIVNDYESINIIKVENLNKTMANLMKIYTLNISKNINIIGVTGTNGKTTVTNIIHNFYKHMKLNIMSIGTLGIKINDDTKISNNTTPNTIDIHNYLVRAHKLGINTLVIEISSHAIKELRVLNLEINHVIFTNITHDHLDYHKTFEDYFYTKARLIMNSKDNAKIYLNKDILNYNLLDSLTEKNNITYSLKKNSMNKLKILNVVNNETTFKLNERTYKTKMLGEFNLYNLAVVITLLKQLKFKYDDIYNFLQRFTNVNGRMDLIKNNKGLIIVDYAHSPDAVLNVLKTLKQFKSPITTVIGCGGNRDNSKRKIIGNITTNLSNRVIFTNDNPRYENEDNILNQIIKGCRKNNYSIIKDRYLAIKEAINNMQKNDIILILGKGHEIYQEIKGEKHDFNEKKIILEILSEE